MFTGFDLDAWTASDTTTPPVVPLPPPSSRPPPREGDWTCTGCGNVNFAKRTKCNQCGAAPVVALISGDRSGDPLEDIPHFGGPPGLFKKGDWPCTHCGNVNWARRSKCNTCNSPKPASTETPRTGRAGGHFDLQDPHDRQQYLSDDEEFDEFGRKKKRKRATIYHQPDKPPIVYTSTLENFTGNMPSVINSKLFFPPAPHCYLKGRTLSMSSNSSKSSDYVEEDGSTD